MDTREPTRKAYIIQVIGLQSLETGGSNLKLQMEMTMFKLFNEEVAKKVLRIPISLANREDCHF